jgi:hypothetical protein
MIKTMEEALELYEQMLDESGPVVVGGIEFSPSAILKEMDPIAYDVGFNDYMNACDIDTDDFLDDEDSDFDDSMDGDLILVWLLPVMVPMKITVILEIDYDSP